MNSSFQSSQKLSPEERQNLELYYEREQYKQKQLSREVDASYFSTKKAEQKGSLRSLP